INSNQYTYPGLHENRKVIGAKIRAIAIYFRCSVLTRKNDGVISLSSLDLSSKLTPLVGSNVFNTDDW
ncbi:MAG: hypothetical protein ACRD5B_10385, partial [Nitrososphaeraceae archaeon]